MPRRGIDYRVQEIPAALDFLNKVPTNEESFWQVAAIAFELLLEGTITAIALPATLKWDAGIIDGIMNLLQAPTYDDLLNQVEALVLPIATQRLRDLEEQQRSDERGDTGDENEAKSSAGEDNKPPSHGEPLAERGENEDSSGQLGAGENDATQASVPQLDAETQENIEREVGEQSNEPTNPDFINENPNAAKSQTDAQEFKVEDLEKEHAAVPIHRGQR